MPNGERVRVLHARARCLFRVKGFGVDGKSIARRVGRVALAAVAVGAVAVSQFVRAPSASADELLDEVSGSSDSTAALADEQAGLAVQLWGEGEAVAGVMAAAAASSPAQFPWGGANRVFVGCKQGQAVCETEYTRRNGNCEVALVEDSDKADPDPKILRLAKRSGERWKVQVIAPMGFTSNQTVRVRVLEFCPFGLDSEIKALKSADGTLAGAVSATQSGLRSAVDAIAAADEKAAAAGSSAGAAAGAALAAQSAAATANSKAETARTTAEAAKTAAGTADQKAVAAKAAADAAAQSASAGVQAAAAAKTAADAARSLAVQAGDDVDAVAASVGALQGSIAANSAAIAALQAGGGSAWSAADIGAVKGGITDLWDKIKEMGEKAQQGRSLTDPGCAENKRADWWTALSAAPTDPCEINEGTLKRQAERSEAASKAAELGRRAYEEGKASEADAKSKAQWDQLHEWMKEGQSKAADGARAIGEKVGELGEQIKGLGESIGKSLAPGTGTGQLPSGSGAVSSFGSATRGKVGQWQEMTLCTVPEITGACTAPWRIVIADGVVWEPIPSKCAPWEPTVRLWIGAAMLVATVFLGVRWIISALGVDTPEGES